MLRAPSQTMLQRRRFDVHEYHRMIEAGILREGSRIELIDGEVVDMHPIGGPHFACVNHFTRILVVALEDRALVSIQGPVRLDDYSEPEPDVGVFRLRDDGYVEALPSAADTLFVIEVGDTSLRYDREIKLPLYARAGIPELWLVDLAERVVEVCRRPEGSDYADRDRVDAGTLSPEAFPELAIPIEEILPRRLNDPAS